MMLKKHTDIKESKPLKKNKRTYFMLITNRNLPSNVRHVSIKITVTESNRHLHSMQGGH